MPWKVCPTTVVSMAPFASARIAGDAFMTSAEPNRFATLRPASLAPFCLGSKYTAVRKYLKVGALAGIPFGGVRIG